MNGSASLLHSCHWVLFFILFLPYQCTERALNTQQSLRIQEPSTLDQVIETGHRYTITCLSGYHCTEPELLCTQGRPERGQVFC